MIKICRNKYNYMSKFKFHERELKDEVDVLRREYYTARVFASYVLAFFGDLFFITDLSPIKRAFKFETAAVLLYIDISVQAMQVLSIIIIKF